MGLRQFFVEALGGRFVEAAGVSLDAEDHGWRKLTGDTNRDLNPMTHDRMQELSLYAWRTNPLANRLIELPVAYLLAAGVRLQCDDEEAQGWLDAFWNDPINCMDIKLPKKARELAIYGEQCWPAFVNEHNGHVRLGYLDPGMIKQVVTDPDNIEQPVGIVTKTDARGRYRKYRIIINGPEDVFTARTRQIRETFSDGDCFYFSVNDLSNASRGHSDILSQLDWLDAYDNALFGELERWDFLRAFIYDVTLKGATPAEVEARARKISTPQSGTTRVHNDSEEWNTVSPDLGSHESSSNARLFRNHILSGSTIPEHWFGGGGDVNRATAGEMGEPSFKVFSMRQAYLGHILCEVGTWQIRQRARAYLGEGYEALLDTEYKVTAVFPELTARDTSKYAAALAQVTTAVMIAIERSLMSEETGVGIIGLIAGQLGRQIDPAEELEKARQDNARRTENENGFPDYPSAPTDDADTSADAD